MKLFLKARWPQRDDRSRVGGVDTQNCGQIEKKASAQPPRKNQFLILELLTKREETSSLFSSK